MSSTDLPRRRHLAGAIDEVARRVDDRLLVQRLEPAQHVRRWAGPTRYSTSGCVSEPSHGAAHPPLPNAIPLGGAEHEHEALGVGMQPKRELERRRRIEIDGLADDIGRKRHAFQLVPRQGDVDDGHARQHAVAKLGRELNAPAGAAATITRMLRSLYFCRRNSACAPAYASVGEPLDVEILGIDLDGALERLGHDLSQRVLDDDGRGRRALVAVDDENAFGRALRPPSVRRRRAPRRTGRSSCRDTALPSEVHDPLECLSDPDPGQKPENS